MTAIKKAIRIIWRTIVAIVTILFAGALIIQLPQVQTFITAKAVEKVSESLDGDIVFEKIHLKPFTTLVIKNVAIIDRAPVKDMVDPKNGQIDTLFRAEYIIARFTLDGLIREEGVHLNRLYLSGAQMNLVIEDKEDAGDGDVTTDNLTRIFRLKKPETESQNEKELFHIRRVEIKDMGFTMKSYQADRTFYEGGIDWNDMNIKDINAKARELQFKGGIMSGQMTEASFREECGYMILELTGKAKVGRGRTIVEDLHIEDPWSDVHLPLFMMSYKNILAFNDFINDVRIDADIKPSSLDFRTIAYFAPELEGNGLKARVSGKMSGPVRGFSFSDMSFESDEGGFSGMADGSISGLPYIDKTHIDAHLHGFKVTSKGLSSFISEWIPDGEVDLSNIAKGTVFHIDAYGKGLIDRLALDADVRSGIGNLKADVRLDDVTKLSKPIGINGSLETEDLDIGKIIGTEILGPTSLHTSSFSASIGATASESSIQVDTLFIDRLHALSYDYTGIQATGGIASDVFTGWIVCADPNLRFTLNGSFATSRKTQNAIYNFGANVGYADLNAINIDKRGKSRVNFFANANFRHIKGANLLGNINIYNVELENNQGKNRIGNIRLKSTATEKQYTISLESGFANASYSGTASILTFFKDFSDLTLKQELPALHADPAFEWSGNSYDLKFRSINSMDLLAFILPGLYISEGTRMDASISRKGDFNASLSSNLLAYGKQYLMKDIKAGFSNAGGLLDGKIRSSEVKMSTINMKNGTIEVSADSNHVDAHFAYDNPGTYVNKGEVKLCGDLSRTEDVLALGMNIEPSAIIFNSKKWDIMPARADISGSDVIVNGFALESGDEKIRLNGRISRDEDATMTLNLDGFDISIINSVMESGLGIRGKATGEVVLTSPLASKGILVDMVCDSTYIADMQLGVLTAESRWNEEMQRFDLAAKNELEGINNINAYGSLTPKGSILNAVAELDRLKIGYAQPFLTDVFSQMDGKISGKITLDGPLSDLSVHSEGTRLEDGLLRVDYTNVPYYADGTFHIDQTGAYFDDVRIRDRFTGTGKVSGGIKWDHFRDITFDTHLIVNEIEGINLSENMGEDFYGNIFGTGNVSITGPISSLMMNVDAVTAKSGSLHIPMIESGSSGKVTNLLRFKEEKVEVKLDPYEAMIQKIEKQQRASSDFMVKLRVNAQPDVEAFIEIDKESGNVLSGRGSGLIDLEASLDRFSINGDYTLNSGNYKFVAMGLISRDFQIQDGSSIRFNGDIMESTVDINAIYRTKASLANLLSDANAVTSKRNVDCFIHITDKLSNPRLAFDIDIPDLDPTIESRVQSAISTDDKIQKQFLSLLVSNDFLPDEQSGIVNNTSVLYSNVTELLANQLNNIFEKLDIPLDLGLNYQPTEQGTDLFDVAVSTQLFNNRVVVNGNIGNQQYNTGGTQNDVVGDLDIEVKIDRSGRFRLNLFSHSADQFSNYLDNSQRNGGGIMYQTEFNSFGKFLRNFLYIFNKEKRKEIKMEEEQAMLQGGSNVIKLTAPAKEKTEEDDRQ